MKCDVNFKYNKQAKYIEDFVIPLQEVNVTLMYSKLFTNRQSWATNSFFWATL